MTYNAIRTTITNGEPEKDIAIFNGQEVMIIEKSAWNAIAGSDSVRFQLEQAQAEIQRLTALKEETI